MNRWRYTKVRAGTKKPYPAEWEKHPLTLDQIPKGDNVGVLLGESSDGLIAIDFDGPSTFNWWAQHVGCAIPETVGWSSGREGRAQFAFTVAPEYWPLVRTVKEKTGVIGADGKAELIEFRWNGCQSIVPPSIHPDTHKAYQYVDDCRTVVAMPKDALEWWVLRCNPVRQAAAAVVMVQIDDDELMQLLSQIKANEPRLSYSDWRDITFSVAHEVGTTKAEIIMRSMWPEESRDEYKKMLKNYKVDKSPTLGSLVYRVKQYRSEK